jgi:hypothetical protein
VVSSEVSAFVILLSVGLPDGGIKQDVLPVYTLSELRTMTVVEFRSACVIVGLPDGGVKQDVLDRLVAHFRRYPVGVSGGSGAGGDANVTSVGIMTLHDSSPMALCTRSSNYM